MWGSVELLILEDYITDLCESKIAVHPDVKKEMERLRTSAKVKLCISPLYEITGSVLKLCYLNARFVHRHQPRSQGLSSLPPLVVGRKTLVAAGHVTTQNQGGKKNLMDRRSGRVFCLLMQKHCGFQIMII